jgi:thiol-disulfide isomerase/thioredoxin
MNSFEQSGKVCAPWRIILSLISFALIGGVGFSACSGPTPTSNNNNVAKTGPGQPPAIVTANNPGAAPPVTAPLSAAVMNTELKLIDGGKFKLSDYRGKVVIVNLWATWCGPCRSEIPDLVKVSEEFKSKGVEVIGLTNEDPDMDLEKVRDFIREFKITYKIGWGDQSFAMGLMQGEQRNSIPQSFIISRDGHVLKRFIGFNPVETPAKLRQALEEAVNSPQG